MLVNSVKVPIKILWSYRLAMVHGIKLILQKLLNESNRDYLTSFLFHTNINYVFLRLFMDFATVV